MEDIKTKIMTWIEQNKTLALAAGAVLVFMIFKKMNAPTRRRRRKKITVTRRRRLGTGTRRRYNKAPQGKKAWQVKGSLAAKRRMAQIRRMR